MTNIDKDIIQFFSDEVSDILTDWEKYCLNLESGYSKKTCESLARIAHNLKGTAHAIGLATFASFVHDIEDLISSIASKHTPITPKSIQLLFDSQSIMQNWLDELCSDGDYFPSEEMEPIKKALAQFKVKSGQEVPLEKDKNDKNVTNTTKNDGPLNQQELDQEFTDQEQGTIRQDNDFRQKKPVAHAQSIRVSPQKLDTLFQLLGELSTQHAIVSHGNTTNSLNSSQCQNAISLTSKLIREVQSNALSLRMHSLRDLFQKLERAAKDVARKQQKSVEIDIEGVHVELDKTVIDKIGDSLVHVLRNAVDHGLETKEERANNNKSETGKIRIEAIQQIDGILIKIEDDGKGLDSEKIVQKAIQKKIIPEGQKLTPHQIHQLILLPGFSTTDKVTHISGRGIGMDILKSSIEDMGGKLEINSTYGQGTAFLIYLPATLNIIDALIIRVSQSNYAVPIQDLSEIIDLSRYSIEPAGTSGKMIFVRGKATPIEDLSVMLPIWDQMMTEDVNNNQNAVPEKVAILTKAGEKRIAFQVDHILGQQTIVVRRLVGDLNFRDEFGGTTIFGDGEPGLILDLHSLTNKFFRTIETDARRDA